MSNLKLIKDITSNILEEYSSKLNENKIEYKLEMMTLSSGLPGAILLASEMLNLTNDNKFLTIMEQYIDYLVKIMSTQGLWTGSLYSGAAGIGVSILHLAEKEEKYQLLLNSLNTYLDYYTKELLNNMDVENISPPEYDIIEGVAGVLIFLLLQNDEELDELKYTILDFLSDRINSDFPKTGLYVKSHNQMTKAESNLYPDGCLNFGLAHGLAGVGISILYAKSKGFYTENSIIAIRNILRFYNRYELTEHRIWKEGLDYEELLTNSIKPVDIQTLRDAWCYGRPGISLLYLYAGIILKENSYKDKAVNILNKSLEQQSGLDSSILCHGLSGIFEICLLFKKLLKTNYFDNHIDKLKNEILRDYDKSIKFGFRTKYQVENQVRENSVGFLDGSVGIVLSLINGEKLLSRTYWKSALLLFDDIDTEA